MRINEIIDKCGLRLLIFIAVYLLLRHCQLSTFNHLLAAITYCRALPDKKKKKTFRELIRVLLAPEGARKFLIAAAVIFIFSIFVSFTVWHVIVAVVNIALAVVCLSGVAARRV